VSDAVDRRSSGRESGVTGPESDADVSSDDRRATESTMTTRDHTPRQRYRTRTDR
jgi:hypothetical protein